VFVSRTTHVAFFLDQSCTGNGFRKIFLKIYELIWLSLQFGRISCSFQYPVGYPASPILYPAGQISGASLFHRNIRKRLVAVPAVQDSHGYAAMPSTTGSILYSLEVPSLDIRSQCHQQIPGTVNCTRIHLSSYHHQRDYHQRFLYHRRWATIIKETKSRDFISSI
jgi:hypothetical protein